MEDTYSGDYYVLVKPTSGRDRVFSFEITCLQLFKSEQRDLARLIDAWNNIWDAEKTKDIWQIHVSPPSSAPNRALMHALSSVLDDHPDSVIWIQNILDAHTRKGTIKGLERRLARTPFKMEDSTKDQYRRKVIALGDALNHVNVKLQLEAFDEDESRVPHDPIERYNSCLASCMDKPWLCTRAEGCAWYVVADEEGICYSGIDGGSAGSAIRHIEMWGDIPAERTHTRPYPWYLIANHDIDGSMSLDILHERHIRTLPGEQLDFGESILCCGAHRSIPRIRQRMWYVVYHPWEDKIVYEGMSLREADTRDGIQFLYDGPREFYTMDVCSTDECLFISFRDTAFDSSTHNRTAPSKSQMWHCLGLTKEDHLMKYGSYGEATYITGKNDGDELSMLREEVGRKSYDRYVVKHKSAVCIATCLAYNPLENRVVSYSTKKEEGHCVIEMNLRVTEMKRRYPWYVLDEDGVLHGHDSLDEIADSFRTQITGPRNPDNMPWGKVFAGL
jgi:hypothetical protein